MASLSLYPQFKMNLMSNRKVIELLLQLKSAKVHGKNYIKVRPPLARILLRNRLFVRSIVLPGHCLNFKAMISEAASLNTISGDKLHCLILALRQAGLVLHDAIWLTNSLVFMLGRCVNLKAIRYEATSFDRTVADKSHFVTLALKYLLCQYLDFTN